MNLPRIITPGDRVNVGFTGTQRGCTSVQLAELRRSLEALRDQGASTFHHGDCIGADAEAHRIAVDLGFVVVLHPPSFDGKRAFCAATFEERPLPYMTRNGNIVQVCAVLLACPGELVEQLRSGTWATVRRARKAHKPIWIHYPTGARETVKP